MANSNQQIYDLLIIYLEFLQQKSNEKINYFNKAIEENYNLLNCKSGMAMFVILYAFNLEVIATTFNYTTEMGFSVQIINIHSLHVYIILNVYKCHLILFYCTSIMSPIVGLLVIICVRKIMFSETVQCLDAVMSR